MSTFGAKSEALGFVEIAMDDNERYIGEEVWEQLNAAYESADAVAEAREVETYNLKDQVHNRDVRIAELESQLHIAKEDARDTQDAHAEQLLELEGKVEFLEEKMSTYNWEHMNAQDNAGKQHAAEIQELTDTIAFLQDEVARRI